MQTFVQPNPSGWGFHHKDVRFVTSMSFHENIEDYLQEAEIGYPVVCAVFFSHQDRSFHLLNIMPIEEEQPIINKHTIMNEMVKYCVKSTCRHKFLMSYFSKCMSECEEHCDICQTFVLNLKLLLHIMHYCERSPEFLHFIYKHSK